MKKVLLVEDDKNISLAFGIRLKAMGYRVCTAQDAVTAVSQIRTQEPDVVVLDISLPGGDGFMVAERMRQMSSAAATPVVFITASQKPGLEDRAKQAGAVHLLRKPFDATQLADAIETALNPGDDWMRSDRATGTV